MNTLPATNILDACEQSLRATAGTALAAGDYDSARQLIAWAENVAAMATTARRQSSPAPQPPPSTPSTPPRPADDEYPRFQRRGDELVKIGWSKSNKKEYHHRAPKHALDTLIATLQRIASDGSHFTSDHLNPLQDSDADTVYPAYQVFVALAWLRKLGLVQQHGKKGGYTLTPDRPLDTTAEAAWLELPKWRGK